MSSQFRDLIKKVGSGSHTSKDLTREEARLATRMMLDQTATPAQIGAFMIAHRIKRPIPEELAGMLDAYEDMGPVVPAIASDYPVMVLGSPYDGRSRTALLSPITALLLAAAKVPVLMHGGDVMPTKAGIPFMQIWQALELPLQALSLSQVHALLLQVNFGFLYLPQHFPQAHALVPYREQIGKRPPFATIELMWTPYAGDSQTVIGFVHPPTEGFAQATCALRGQSRFTTVKGLEGSCDLPRARTAIIGLGHADGTFERLLLHPRDYGFEGEEVPLASPAALIQDMRDVLAGKPSELMQSAIWNGGFYLWRSGVSHDLESGFALAKTLLLEGAAQAKLEEIRVVAQDLALASV